MVKGYWTISLILEHVYNLSVPYLQAFPFTPTLPAY